MSTEKERMKREAKFKSVTKKDKMIGNSKKELIRQGQQIDVTLNHVKIPEPSSAKNHAYWFWFNSDLYQLTPFC